MTTNAQLTAQMNDLLAQWQVREDEMRAWLAGTADGGPNGDGRYPLTDAEGTTYLVDCPAKLEDMIDGPSAAAGEAAAEAVAAAADALAAVTSAKDAESMANAAKTATLSLKNLVDGQQADVAAKWSDVNTWWNAVGADTVTTVAAKDLALTYRDEAQAAAAAAQTFDPVNYLALTGGEVSGLLSVQPMPNDTDYVHVMRVGTHDWYAYDTGGFAFTRLHGRRWTNELIMSASSAGAVTVDVIKFYVTGPVPEDSYIEIAGNKVWHEGTFDPTDYLALTGGTVTGTVVYEHPSSGSANLSWNTDDYLRYRFGGSGTPKGISISHFDTTTITLNRNGHIDMAGDLTVQGRDVLAEIDALEARIAALEAA